MPAQSLDRLIAAGIAPDNIPGMALRIRHKGETIYDKCFGYMDFEQKKAMEAPLKEYLPEFSRMMVQTREGLVPAKRDIGILYLLRMIFREPVQTMCSCRATDSEISWEFLKTGQYMAAAGHRENMDGPAGQEIMRRF